MAAFVIFVEPDEPGLLTAIFIMIISVAVITILIPPS